RAEAQHDAQLVGLDAIEARQQPDRDHRGDAGREPPRRSPAARQQAAEPVLALAQEIVELRRLRPAAPAPRALIAGTAPRSATAAVIVPGQSRSFRALYEKGRFPYLEGRSIQPPSRLSRYR